MFTQTSKTHSDRTKTVSVNREKAQGVLASPCISGYSQNVMQLQSTIGNSAVLQLLKSQFSQQGGLPIQLKEAGSDTSSNLLADRFRINKPSLFYAPVQKKSDSEMGRHKNNTGMPDSLKAGIENLSGFVMDDVRVHYNSEKPAEVGALAYTQGTDIHVASGQEKNLPHEVWHVIQQKQGRVKPTGRINGIGFNDDIELENEADFMAGKSLLAKPDAHSKYAGQSNNRAKAENQKSPSALYSSQSDIIQRAIGDGQDNVYVKSSSNEVYLAKWNENLHIYELYSLDDKGIPDVYSYSLSVSPDDNKYSITKKPEVVFSFNKKGRRIETSVESNTEFLPDSSVFSNNLMSYDKQTHDFSYQNLRDIMEQAINENPNLTKEDIDNAIKAGIDDFNPDMPEILLNSNFNKDLQLLVHHILKFQSFNLGPLKDKPKNKNENAFRAQEIKKSKLMIANSLSLGKKGIDLIIPKKPDLKNENPLQDAMSGLIDLNRPLPDSIFESETYKAVFLLAKKLLKNTFNSAQKSIQDKKKQILDQKDEIDEIKEQRSNINKEFFKLLPEMTNSTIPIDKGRDFVEKQLHFHYNSDEDSFDEKSESDSESIPNEEIYNPEDSFEMAVKKRSTALNSFALLSKIEAQKELIDLPDAKKTTKRQKMRKKIERKAKKLNERYESEFNIISKESIYYNKKLKMINKVLKSIKSFKPKPKAKNLKQSKTEVNKVKLRAENDKKDLSDYYSKTKVGLFIKEHKKDSRWKSRKESPKIFKMLGNNKTMKRLYSECKILKPAKIRKSSKRKPINKL